MKRISFIVVNHNYGRYLKECLDSILMQTTEADEVIVVDNGSTDDSASVIRGYGERVIAHFQENLGQACGHLSGWEVASGRWIWTVDADDFLLPGGVDSMVAGMQQGCGMVHGEMKLVGDQGEEISKALPEMRQVDSGDLRPLFLQYGHAFLRPTSANLYRRDVMDDACQFLRDLEKPAWFLDGICHVFGIFSGQVGWVPGPVTAYRVHAGHYGMARQGRFDLKSAEKKVFLQQATEKAAQRCASSHGKQISPAVMYSRFDLIWAICLVRKVEPDAACLRGIPEIDLSGWTLRAFQTQRFLGWWQRIFRALAVCVLVVLPASIVRKWGSR
jgi:glycosyltransferase involved in cell wall biosynthesis